MNIYHIYEDFAKYSEWELLRTTFDMVHDGLMMSHCVATYIDKVDSGQCGIYKVDGHTIELNFGYGHTNYKPTLRVSQIKGYKNASAPQELVDTVLHVVSLFNTYELPNIKLEKVEEKPRYAPSLWEVEDLPF